MLNVIQMKSGRKCWQGHSWGDRQTHVVEIDRHKCHPGEEQSLGGGRSSLMPHNPPYLLFSPCQGQARQNSRHFNMSTSPSNWTKSQSKWSLPKEIPWSRRGGSFSENNFTEWRTEWTRTTAKMLSVHSLFLLSAYMRCLCPSPWSICVWLLGTVDKAGRNCSWMSAEAGLGNLWVAELFL